MAEDANRAPVNSNTINGQYRHNSDPGHPAARRQRQERRHLHHVHDPEAKGRRQLRPGNKHREGPGDRRRNAVTGENRLGNHDKRRLGHRKRRPVSVSLAVAGLENRARAVPAASPAPGCTTVRSDLASTDLRRSHPRHHFSHVRQCSSPPAADLMTYSRRRWLTTAYWLSLPGIKQLPRFIPPPQACSRRP